MHNFDTYSYELGEKAKTFFLLLLVFITANSCPIITDEFLMGIFFITLVVFFLKKQKFDMIIPVIMIVWSGINFASYMVNETSFDVYTFIGFIIKIIYPYMILKLVGYSFFYKLERIIFFLAIISLPLFAIQMMMPAVMIKVGSLFNFMTIEDKQFGGGFYAGIFRLDGYALDRNSGFMWEPGAFAFMLLLGLLLRIMRFGLKLDLTNMTYIITLITTFSTMAYIAMLFLLILYVFKSKKVGYILFILPLGFLYMGFVTDLDFMLPKLNQYVLHINSTYTPQGYDYLKLNRLGFLLYALEQASYWPFGYGIVPSKFGLYYGGNFEGVGTLSYLLIYWGWAGVLFFIYALYRYCKTLKFDENNDKILPVFSTIIFLTAFFSNPFQKSPILFLIVFFPFIFKKNQEAEYV